MRPVVAIATAVVTSFAGVAAQRGPVSAPGDPAAGKAIFEGSGRCLTCHSVDDRGGSFGPELSWIGLLRTPESLEQSLTNPDADIARRYFTVVVETRKGQRIEGLALNEDDFSIQIRDVTGDLRSFIKSDVTAIRREPRSFMRSHGPELPLATIPHLVSYLRTLRTLWPVERGERTRAIAPATDNAAFFDRPERDREERPDLLLEALEIPRGATVADIGAGTGYFTWRLAQRVGPRGKVYAVDVQQTMLEMTREAVGRRKLDNVDYLLTTGNDPQLPDSSIDLAFVAYAYHEFADPERMMAGIRRALAPGGRVFILEYAKESRAAPASPLHKMSFEEIRREIEPLGFVVDRLLDFLPAQHGVVFTLK